MRLRRCLLLVVPIYLLAISPHRLNARQIDDAKLPSGKSLLGVKKIVVEFWGLADDINKDGLREDAITTDISLKFRQAGIPIEVHHFVPFAVVKPSTEPGDPNFIVNLETFKNGDLYAFYVTAQFKQMCLLERLPQQKIHVATWQERRMGTVGAGNVQQLRDTIKDLTDKFIDVYLTVNPKN